MGLAIGPEHLAFAPKLLAVGLQCLRLRLTGTAHLLALELTRLGLLDTSLARLLASRLDAGFSHLLASGLTLDARRTFGADVLDAFGANLLALNAGGTFGPGLLDAFGANLLALDSSGTFGAHLNAFGTLRPFRARHLLTLRPRLLARLSLLPFGTSGLPVLLRPRIGRGRDRQCGDTRGEEYPGHHNFSFSTALTAMGPHRSHA
jgi:hypothetical protein